MNSVISEYSWRNDKNQRIVRVKQIGGRKHSLHFPHVMRREASFQI